MTDGLDGWLTLKSDAVSTTTTTRSIDSDDRSFVLKREICFVGDARFAYARVGVEF